MARAPQLFRARRDLGKAAPLCHFNQLHRPNNLGQKKFSL